MDVVASALRVAVEQDGRFVQRPAEQPVEEILGRQIVGVDAGKPRDADARTTAMQAERFAQSLGQVVEMAGVPGRENQRPVFGSRSVGTVV